LSIFHLIIFFGIDTAFIVAKDATEESNKIKIGDLVLDLEVSDVFYEGKVEKYIKAKWKTIFTKKCIVTFYNDFLKRICWGKIEIYF